MVVGSVSRFAPVFSVAEQTFAPVSASLQAFARATRCCAFPALALPAFVPVDWSRAPPLDDQPAAALA
jgi:hypothetical protein